MIRKADIELKDWLRDMQKSHAPKEFYELKSGIKNNRRA